MIWAILKKEWRETWGYAMLALALSGIYVCRQTGIWSRMLSWILGWVPGLDDQASLPFIQSGFGIALGLIGILLAIALGVWQSMWDTSQGTSTYLLHLPLQRHTYFLTKLSAGIGLLLVTMLLPILFYASWAAWPGTHPAPFELSMMDPAIRLWLLLPLVYLGAFASGFRPARWFGSRLLPLISVAVPAILFYYASWLMGLPLWLLSAAGLTSNILVEASTRDF